MRWLKQGDCVDDGGDRRLQTEDRDEHGRIVRSAHAFEKRDSQGRLSGIDTAALYARRDALAKLREDKGDHFGFVSTFASEVDFAQMMYAPTATSFEPWRPGKLHWKVLPSQLGFYTDDFCVGFAGRFCGKTKSFLTTIAQRMCYYPYSNAIFTSHDINHVDERMVELFMTLDAHPLLSTFVSRGTGARQAKHPHRQYMKNGFVIYGLSGGKTETASAAVESPHVNCLYGDEFQEYSEWAWRKIQNSINDYYDNREHGACFKVFGVNSSGRIDTIFYSLAHKDVPYKEHVYRLPSWNVPWYKPLAHIRNLAHLGGSIYASEFMQQVRGLTGDRAKGVFSDEDYAKASELHEDLTRGRFRMMRINRKTFDAAAGNPNDLFARFFHEPGDGEARQCVMSADYGTSAPTVIGVWYEQDHPTLPTTIWTLWNLIELIGIRENDQVAMFDYLLQTIRPRWLSVDSTGSTGYVYNSLIDPNDVRYNDKGYDDVVYPSTMNGDMTIDYSLEKPPDAVRFRVETIANQKVYARRERSIVFCTEEIARMMAAQRLALPTWEILRREHMTLVAKINALGQVSYVGNDQHNISMERALTQLLHTKGELLLREEQVLGGRDAAVAIGSFFGLKMGGVKVY